MNYHYAHGVIWRVKKKNNQRQKTKSSDSECATRVLRKIRGRADSGELEVNREVNRLSRRPYQSKAGAELIDFFFCQISFS